MKFLEGKKTFIGLFMVLLGYLGFSEFISEDEMFKVADSVIQIVGIAVAFYGRIKVKK